MATRRWAFHSGSGGAYEKVDTKVMLNGLLLLILPVQLNLDIRQV
jgi:hypothetical protein